ncbi:Sec1-like protein [Protomyces lactucae-debilis]|uniref:Sec1-like protein n=1 Tax=Protomyces lactucae-debilis TaxID=2754530 RepID=A0A1Y2FDM3_PROLT|nr:Sec1-like protein [Protomyces lactucae-debilis]ORY81416.1 Sec1-like protein [Protomyces lactucae-debilis]
MRSLLDSYKQAILGELRAVQPQNKWKVLILDRQSSNLIQNVMPLSEFYDENVTDVQIIENIRDANASFEAVYMLMPKEQVIQCLVHDLKSSPRLYASSHLIFMSPLSDALLSKLRPFSDRIGSLKEQALDFVPAESQVFLTHNRQSPFVLYNPSCAGLVEAHIKDIADKIVCMCAFLGEYPMIRYYKPHTAQHTARSLCAKLANVLQAGLDDYSRSNESFPPQTDRPRSILFICDRTMDLYAPLVHEFTFQSMANDLLPIRDGVFYEYEIVGPKGREKVQEVISEDDAAWTSVRHMHMSLAIDKLVHDFNKFSKDNESFTSEAKATNLNTIRNMLANMDSYAQGKDKYSLYINMAQDCMNIFEKNQLPLIAQIEQNCATGLTVHGKPPKDTLETLVPLLDDERIPMEDRTRLLMIYINWKQGIFPDDRSKLCRHAKIRGHLQEAIANLDLLGVPASKTSRNKKKVATTAPANVDEAFELSRYQPRLKDVIEQHFQGTLSLDDFPYTRDLPPEATPGRNSAPGSSLRTNRPAWAKGRSNLDVPKQRVLCFVAGGATYSEVRACYELSETLGRDVLLGSTHLSTPNDFISSLSHMRADRRELGLEVDRAPAKIPLLEPRPKPAAVTTNKMAPPSHTHPAQRSGVSQTSSHAPQASNVALKHLSHDVG